MKIEPNGPSPPAMKRLLRGLPISIMSPMPVAPMGTYPGTSALIFWSTPLWSTPVMIGRLWPIWFIV
jgi:hypothetical protein